MTGQNYINIPPRSLRVVVKANCSSSDTSRFIVNGPVYITSALNHMHYLGIEFINYCCFLCFTYIPKQYLRILLWRENISLKMH